MTNIDYKRFPILHGEDDKMDARLIQLALKNISYDGEYTNLDLGQDLVDWMNDKTKHSLPGLIMLDIGLPGINGKEVLGELRKNSQTQIVPIIMMSGSISQRDYHECIALGANGYIQKSTDLSNMTEILRRFIEGWSLIAKQTFL